VGVPGEGEENDIDVAVGHRAGREGSGERLSCRSRLVRQVVGDVLRTRMCGSVDSAETGMRPSRPSSRRATTRPSTFTAGMCP
jgi:hypothetical protein